MPENTSRPASSGQASASGGVRPRAGWPFLVIALALVVHAGLAWDAARRLTVTHDEYWHLPVGLLNLETGRFGFDNLNPPLVRMWAALPLLGTSVELPVPEEPADPTAVGDLLVEAAGANYVPWLTYGRTMIVLLSVGTGILLAYWGGRLFGPGAAVLVAVLWAFSPTVLAGASLVTTDLAAAGAFVAVLSALWAFLARPGWKQAVLLGLCLGVAQLVKYTSAVLYPLCLVMWCVFTFLAWRDRRRQRAEPSAKEVEERQLPEGPVTAATWPQQGGGRTAGQLAGKWCAIVGLSLLVMNAGYLFRGSFQPAGSYSFASGLLSRLNEGWLSHVPLPLPADYVAGLDRQRQIMESQHPVFLDGEWSTEGFPQYYLMTLLWKLPHVLQGLLLLAVLWVLRPTQEPPLWRTQLFLAFPVVVLLAVASSSGMQLGLRYILPAFPFVLLAAGQTARWCSWRKYRWRTVLVVLLVAVWPLSLRYHPRHLAYFNEAAGGPVEGRWHLLDSNLDWGQDLRELKAWLDSQPQPVADLGLAYFGTMPPQALGIRYEVPPSGQPQPGWYGVSVNFVMGRPHQLRTPEGTFRSVGLDEFGYFRFFEPRTRIGSSIDVYHLTPADVSRWQYAVRQMQSGG